MSHRNTSPETNDTSAFLLFGTHIPSQDVSQPAPSTPTSVNSLSCSAEDSENDHETPSSEGLETVCPTDNDSDAVDRKPDHSTDVVLKKPDKILPCPRCNSMETKFCYFNNYNVNQPRHFCRSCQRYWTAGGSVRNLPVGAGRRKSKHASLKLQSITKSTSEGHTSLVNLTNCTDQLTLEEHEKRVEAFKASYGERIGDPSTSCSSLGGNEASQKCIEVQQVHSSAGSPSMMQSLQGFPVPLPYPYLWNVGLNGMSHGGSNGNAFLLPSNHPPMPMFNGFCLPNMAYPFAPSFAWNWAGSPAEVSSSGNTPSPLGKHSRDLKSQDEEKTERSLWIPKTLRIDDPEEAAKSSIWSTLGITPGKSEPISKGGIFKAFHSSTERCADTSEAENALGANPAALSRSQRFHENS